MFCQEPPILGFLGAMVFAMPALRNSACLAPVGSRYDFLGFFWAEAIALLALFICCVRMYFDSVPTPK